MIKIRLVGDTHGGPSWDPVYNWYKKLVTEPGVDYSFHLGDLGFDYTILAGLNTAKHKVVMGNHDDYIRGLNYGHSVRIYATEIQGIRIFCLGGAYSIDRASRKVGYDWFWEEELSFAHLYKAYLDYIKFKPDILLSHECSTEGIELMKFKGISLNPEFKIQSVTQQTLQKMVEAWRPKLAVSGHWHCKGSKKYKGCEFVGLGIKDYVDILISPNSTFKRVSRSINS